MGLLQKLKSALGLDASGSPSAGTTTPQDVDVTVEREPSSESEDAVKGTDTSGEQSNGELDSEEPLVEDAEETASDSTGDDASTGTGEDEESEDAGTEPAAVDDDTTETETVEDGSSSDGGPPVTDINGIGPAYAERLENAGVSTVSDLAAADADELGEATDLSPNRISGWIEQADSF